jgi:hypothetical protein
VGANGAMGLGLRTFLKDENDFFLQLFMKAPAPSPHSPHFYISIYLCNISLKEYERE